MTREEFLKLMDKVKLVLVNTNGRETHNRFTCNIISKVKTETDNFSASVKIRRKYESLFELNNNPTFDDSPNPFLTRIAALELFEIISLEQNLYLNY